MKNSIKVFSTLVLLSVLVACVPKIDVKVGCQLLEAAGVNREFHLTVNEKKAMTHDHKVILKNILDWYRSHC